MNIDLYPDRNALKNAYRGKSSTYRTTMIELWRDIENTLKPVDAHVTIKGRIKSFDSYFEKLLKRLEHYRCSGSMEPIYDVIALRVVCPFMENVDQAEALMQTAYTILDVEHKGEQHTPGEFGYNCTHLVIAIPEHIRKRIPNLDIETAEVQIRTILQDAWAEVEHELIYKSRIAPLDIPLRRKLAALNATLSLSDITFQEIRDYQRKLHKELNKRRQSFSVENATQHPQRHTDSMATSSWESESRNSVNSLPVTSNSLDELLVEALHAHNRQDYTAAIELYTRILNSSVEPHLKAIVLIHRGIAHYCQNRYEQALDDFTLSVQCEPGNGRGFYHLGTVHRVLGNLTDAVRYLKKSIELNPYRIEAMIELANVFFETGEYSDALEFCTKVLNICPDMQAALHLRSAIQEQITSEKDLHPK